MITKNVFRTWALILALPTLLLTTSCSHTECLNDRNGIEVENGNEFPVTINAASKVQATRANYNAETMRLSFNKGDQLLVSGKHKTAGRFAGILVWTSGATFEGLITTENKFTGTAYNILEEASSTTATLLPNDYDIYGYLSISGYGCSSILDLPTTGKAFADTKAHGVEQLSYVHSDSYKNGFSLWPGNAILSCTITNLTPNKKYFFKTTDGTHSPSGTVTTDEFGNATFAVAFVPNGLQKYCIQIGDGTEYHDISIGSYSMESGFIYSVHKEALEK